MCSHPIFSNLQQRLPIWFLCHTSDMKRREQNTADRVVLVCLKSLNSSSTYLCPGITLSNICPIELNQINLLKIKKAGIASIWHPNKESRHTNSCLLSSSSVSMPLPSKVSTQNFVTQMTGSSAPAISSNSNLWLPIYRTPKQWEKLPILLWPCVTNFWRLRVSGTATSSVWHFLRRMQVWNLPSHHYP